MNEWMNNPAMKNIDPVKLELIRMAAEKTSGKSGRDLAPIMLALITSANKKGIRFSPDEMSLILEILKEGKIPCLLSVLTALMSYAITTILSRMLRGRRWYVVISESLSGTGFDMDPSKLSANESTPPFLLLYITV